MSFYLFICSFLLVRMPFCFSLICTCISILTFSLQRSYFCTTYVLFKTIICSYSLCCSCTVSSSKMSIPMSLVMVVNLSSFYSSYKFLSYLILFSNEWCSFMISHLCKLKRDVVFKWVLLCLVSVACSPSFILLSLIIITILFSNPKIRKWKLSLGDNSCKTTVRNTIWILTKNTST